MSTTLRQVFMSLILIALLGAGGYLLLHTTHGGGGANMASAETGFFTASAPSAGTEGAASSTPSLPPREAPARCGQSDGAVCVEYRSATYHFSLFHSDQKTVKAYDEGGGAATFTFENFDNVHGFQIFVVPYGGDKVTETRFKEDEPSGIRKDMKNVTIDGATGAAFYSSDLRLGDTYEIWFIHGGYLYEVTTLAPRASSLDERMQTWKFI